MPAKELHELDQNWSLKANQRLWQLQQKQFSHESKENNKVARVVPDYDIYRLGDVLFVEIELPGLQENQISVEIFPPHLKIVGHFPPKREVPDDAYSVKKRKYGDFHLEFFIPEQTQIQQYKTYYNLGLLEIQIHLANSPMDTQNVINRNETI